jgi:hypothetical protein
MIHFKEYLIENSVVSQQAHSLGLRHVGYGRFADQHGKITHLSRFGKLVHVSKVKDFQTLKDGQLKHLEHADDEVFNNGVHGTRNVLDHIHAMAHGDDRVKISQKIDGSPSVVFGTHPDTKKFFVASKSAFNKDPKINYTDEDIERNHGHAPGLAQKLKELLKHGPKLGVKGVVQGDMLYGEHDREHTDSKVSFKPNTIRYSIDKNHPEGQKVAKSKIGVALHTRYEDGKAVLDPNIETKSHPDVYNMPVAVDGEKMKFDTEKLKHHASEIGKGMQGITKEGWEGISHPKIAEHVKTYINSKVRKGEDDYNVPELIRHIHDKGQKDIDSVKTAASKMTKVHKRNELLAHVRTHAGAFKRAFAIQSHINQAKHHIIDRLNHNQTFGHHYDSGEEAAPEGYVAIGHHGPIKFVNRAGFSAANFAQSANRK